MVGIVGLRVNLPDQGFVGPDRAHKRVFAADKIEVAGPQQVVKVALVKFGQIADLQ